MIDTYSTYLGPDYVFFSQLIDYAKKGDTDEKAMKMASFWLTVSVCNASKTLWGNNLCCSGSKMFDFNFLFNLSLFSSLQEKDLVPKLFKVLAPRFETQQSDYTRMARIPTKQNLDKAKMAVLEYKGNPFPPLYPVKKENELTLINQLLKGYREEKAQQLAAKA